MRREDVRAMVLDRLCELHALPVSRLLLSEGIEMEKCSPALWTVVSSWYSRARSVSFGDFGTSITEAEGHKARMLALLDIERIGTELAWLRTVLPSPDNGNR